MMITLTPDTICEEWNSHAELPTGRLTPKRRQAFGARIKDHPDIDTWVTGIANIAASAFCLGQNDRGWKATLGWLSERRDAVQRAAEGSGATRTPKPPPAVHVPSQGTQTRASELTKLEHLAALVRPQWQDSAARRAVYEQAHAANIAEIDERWPV